MQRQRAYISHDDDEQQVDARGGHAADQLRVEAQLLGDPVVVEARPLRAYHCCNLNNEGLHSTISIMQTRMCSARVIPGRVRT